MTTTMTTMITTMTMMMMMMMAAKIVTTIGEIRVTVPGTSRKTYLLKARLAGSWLIASTLPTAAPVG